MSALSQSGSAVDVYQIAAGGNCVAASNGSTSGWQNAPAAFVTFESCTDPRSLWSLTKDGLLYNQAENCYLAWGEAGSGSNRFSCWSTPLIPPHDGVPFAILPFSMTYVPDMSRNDGNGNMSVNVAVQFGSQQVGYFNNWNGQNRYLTSAPPGDPNNDSISIIPGGYACDVATSKCAPVTGQNAQFSTMAECQGQCKPGVRGWSCDPNSGKCVPDPKGTWTSRTACNAKCTYSNKRAKDIAVGVMVALGIVIIGVFVWIWFKGRNKSQTEQQKIVNLLTEPVPPALVG